MRSPARRAARPRTPIGRTSTPRDGATAWSAPNWPPPAGFSLSRRIAARVTFGAISLSTSSHLPLKPYSNWLNPVTLPPGRAKLSTAPVPTGSIACTNTIGIVWVACCSEFKVRVAAANRTSGASAASSLASLRSRSGSSVAQRKSICRLRPTVQPFWASACKNAAERTDDWGSSAGRLIKMPTRRIRSLSWACAASGHATAVPPSRVMNSRRCTPALTRSPRRRGRAVSVAR